MADMFNMDLKEFRRHQKFLKKAPRAVRAAVAFTLNGFALGNKRFSKDIIHSQMTVRNPKFIDGSLKTVFAKPSQSVNTMSSIFGSVNRPRYTGLREQQMGTSPRLDRSSTRASREGVRTRAMKGYARLKPQGKYPSPNQPMSMNKTRDGRDFGLSGLTGAKRIVAFLSILAERKVAQTFILRKPFGRFKKGLYRFKQGVIKKLQSFTGRGKPKRVKWLTKGMDSYFKSINLDKVFTRNLINAFKKIN
jgi:hypothetical protein